MDRDRFLSKLRQLQGDVPLEPFARKLRIHPSHLSRLYRRQRSPGLRTVQGALRAFPHVPLYEWGLPNPKESRGSGRGGPCGVEGRP